MGTLSYNERQGRPFLRAGGKVSAGGLMQRWERVGDKRRKGPALRTDPFA